MSRTPRLTSALPAHASIAVLGPYRPDAPPPGEVVHDHVGMALFLSGNARFWMSREYLIAAGDLLIVPEGMPHYGLEMEDVVMLTIALCSHCMRGGWGSLLTQAIGDVRRGKSAVRRLGVERTARVERIVESLRTELEEQSSKSDLMVDGLMSQLAVEIDRADEVDVENGTNDARSHIVMDALEVVRARAHEAISLSDVARTVGRSPAHLATMVKEETGRTVVEWVTHARMAVARRLLISSDDTIEAIADAVGYASPSHFHRTFRREHSYTPDAWRRAHRR